MKPLLICVAALCAAVLGGCASNPDVTFNYYLTESTMRVKVVRTVACDAAQQPIIATTVTPTIVHSADLGAQRSLALSELDNALANNDFKIERYEDGRLKAVNATATGQGEAILKSLLSVATPFLGLDGGSRAYATECQFIATHGANKPLTLTYAGDVVLTGTPAGPAANLSAQEIKGEDASLFYQANLANMIGTVCAQVDPARAAVAPVTGGADTKGGLLRARQPATAEVRIVTGAGRPCGAEVAWQGLVPVAQGGVEYDLPIPRASAFGKRVFAVTFAESGALTTAQYANETGAAGALNVLAATTAAFDTSDTEKAAELKAQADVIAQQQRLVVCLADPANCK